MIGGKTLDKLNIVVYMANRYSACSCTKCGQEFWFMIKELVPDESKSELLLRCPVCEFGVSVPFGAVQANFKKDGYDIGDLTEFSGIRKQVEIHDYRIKTRLN